MKLCVTKALCAALPLLAPIAASAETIALDLSALPGQTVYEAATLTPLALTPEGTPLVITLHIADGDELPAHATASDLRLLTVIEGTLYWGDGDVVDPEAETAYPTGSMLIVPAGLMHWAAARDGDVRLQAVVLPETAPTPPVQAQLQ